jgi:Tse2 ADP-ribosyltransferase toxins
MSDNLKNEYARKQLLDNFFDNKTPIDLFRRRDVGDSTPVMQPTLIGFVRREGDPRRPDIFLSDEKGQSPQHGADNRTILTEPKGKPLTKQIVADGSKYVVRGCRTTAGDYRGVSVFDEPGVTHKKYEWFTIPEGTPIPPGLAVTRDGKKRPGVQLHHTIAPKDDMPFTLFLQHLKGFEAVLKKAGN